MELKESFPREPLLKKPRPVSLLSLLLLLLLPTPKLPPPNKASKGLKTVVSLDVVPLLVLFKNIWFKKEVSDSLDGKKEENGKSLTVEEGEVEDGDPREENNVFEEEEGEASIANGPNNSLSFERLKSPFEFLEKLSKLARPEVELLFIRELSRLKDGWEKVPPLQRSDRSSMPQMVCKLRGGIDFIMEEMFRTFPEEELKRFFSTFLVELFKSDFLTNSEELSLKLLKFKEDKIPCNIGTFSLSRASPVELVSCFRDSDELSESISKE